MIERDFPLLNLTSTDEYFQQVVLSAANQSALDSSLIDSIELYHLAGAPDKVIETVNRALGQSLSLPNAAQQVTRSNDLGISGAFGGADDLYGLARRVHEVYEPEFAKRGRAGKNGWETLGVLLSLKKGLQEFSQGRPDVALQVGISRYSSCSFFAPTISRTVLPCSLARVLLQA
jgi:nuclear pore complex protein Nup93